MPPPAALSTWPLASATVTSSAASFGTDPDTRWTIESIAVLDSVFPGAVLTSTDAVGFAASEVKTSSWGSARWTTADWMPSIAWTVLDSSPSSARW